MKKLHLKSSALILLILLSAVSCVDEPCLDIAQLDKYSAETKEWFVNDTIGNQQLIDINGIKQSLVPISSNESVFDEIIEDDCGNTYDRFNYQIQYKTSISPFNFKVYISGGYEEDDFYIELECVNNQTANQIITAYNFISKICTKDNAVITEYDELEIQNKTYYGVLKITFNSTPSINDIKTLYYTKSFGIIKFTQGNGNEYEVY